MIAVTISVTKSPLLMEQIHFIAIQNITQDDRCAVHTYAVTLDGEDIGAVNHYPTAGALVLVESALGIITDDIDKRATRRLVELLVEEEDQERADSCGWCGGYHTASEAELVHALEDRGYDE